VNSLLKLTGEFIDIYYQLTGKFIGKINELVNSLVQLINW